MLQELNNSVCYEEAGLKVFIGQCQFGEQAE